MKKFCFLFFILISQIGYAQNWTPFYVNERYNYRLDTADVISANFFTDSVKIQNNDSVFYLNRIVKTVADSSNILYALKNRAQFWQKEMIKMDSGVYIFRDSDKITLPTLAGLNYTWIFDSLKNISAIVSVIVEDTIFGNLDSVKVITLSTHDTVKLSQHYGLIKFPPYYNSPQQLRLTGIRGRNLGELMPTFLTIWGQYNPGNLINYYGGSWCGCPGSPPTTYENVEYKILSNATVIGDSIITYDCLQFVTDGLLFEGTTPMTFDTVPVIKTQWIIKLSSHWLLKNISCNALIPYSDFLNGYGVLTLDKSFYGLRTITISGEVTANNCFSCSDSLGISGAQNYNIYADGIGLTQSHFWLFEGSNDTSLTCFSGLNSFPHCNDIFPAGLSETNAQKISIAPNPFSDNIKINNCPLNSEIEITDITGKIVFHKQTTENNFIIPVSGLPAGVYFAHITGDRNNYNQKLIKQD